MHQTTSGRPISSIAQFGIHDVPRLEHLKQAFDALSGTPGLFHCTRVCFAPDGVCRANTDLPHGWEEFLGDKTTTAHSTDEGRGTLVHQSCFFGNLDKLDEYTPLAAAVLPHFPPGTAPCFFPHRDAITDRNQWTLGLYRYARRIPHSIAVDGRGVTEYSRWNLTGEMAIDFFQGNRPQSGGITSLEQLLERRQQHLPNCTSSPPKFIYAALRTDLCAATALAIEHLLSEIHAGQHRPRASALLTMKYAPPIANCTSTPSTTEANGGHASTAGSSDPWPPDEGWHFRPGMVAFGGVTFEISGRLATLLQTLANQRFATPATELCEREDYEVTLQSIRSDISRLRQFLRTSFGLPNAAAPIQRTGRGKDLTYKLNAPLLLTGSNLQTRQPK